MKYYIPELNLRDIRNNINLIENLSTKFTIQEYTENIVLSVDGYYKCLEDSVIKYKIIEKKAGIRPATKDRRPFVGFHPSNKKIGIINGLGSKGISLAPYCTKILIDNIFNNKNINKEINIKRYISLY